MDQRTKSVIIGFVFLFVLITISVSIFYFGKISNKNFVLNKKSANDSLSNLPIAPNLSSSPTPTTAKVGNVSNKDDSNTKIYQGNSFSLRIPKNWGILSCGNSENFEFDPLNSTDIKNVACDTAVKPITILVANRLNCRGEIIKIGERQVTKSKELSNSTISYRWCIPFSNESKKGLDITHRVTSSGLRASSTQDFSQKIEEIIVSIK